MQTITPLSSLELEKLLVPLLCSLPSATVSPQPPSALLPLLSPILRQRVQLLSSGDAERWLPLLCYDAAQLPGLDRVARDESLEPHPVSGQVEVDWESQVETRYKRIDEETLQTRVTLRELGLSTKLVWCVNDEVGGGDGWRIGDVGVSDDAGSWGEPSIAAAESAFQQPATHMDTSSIDLHSPIEGEDEDEDDDYWAQYDTTPGHTPAPQESPAPEARVGPADEDSYYAQYASVQPAMDNHDPDEAQQNGEVETSLGRDEITRELQSTLSPQDPGYNEPPAPWSEAPPYLNDVQNGNEDGNVLAQPRPSSSHGSSGSDTVARLERRAAQNSARGQSETGIKQHISSSMKSLYRLAKVGGIDREEFERLVRTELECLSLMDEDEA